MKKNTVATLLASGLLAASLAAGMAGCASNNTAQGTANSAPETPSSVAAEPAATSSTETSDAENLASSTAATPDAAAPSSNEEPPAPPTADAATSAAPEAGTPQGMQPQNMPGGMGGNGMDTMPGQVTDKGYTANDQGIAISATLDAANAFTERDLAQTADTANATTLDVRDGQDITITDEGVYVITGAASESTIVVDAADTAKVQLVLDGVSITNTDFPAIYVKSADKVFVTLEGENSLAVTGEFTTDGDTSTDAVIFSKDDLCLSGTGSLSIASSDHAIVSKDDLKVTGGTYTIEAAGSALRANDSVRIADGTFTINAADGIKAKNDDDNELGYVYVKGGTFDITTTDNCIQGYAFVCIDGGTMKLTGAECIEGTYIQINGGSVEVNASDDGINASIKSSVYTPTIDITGGEVTVNMASGDTDALDSNGYLYISGGTVNINAQFAFDYVWGAEMTGGEVYVNGEQVSEITESMMGGGMGGGFGGGRPDRF